MALYPDVATAVANDMQHYVSFGELSGTDIADALADGDGSLDSTMSGDGGADASIVTGQWSAKARDLSANSGAAVINNAAASDATNHNLFHLSFWFKNNSTDVYETFLEFDGPKALSFLTRTIDRLEVVFDGQSFYPAGVISDGDWHLIECRHDGGAMRVYIDGDFKTSLANGDNLYPAYDFTVGQGTSLDFQIQDLGIWDRGLDTTERAAIWNSGAGQPLIDPNPAPATRWSAEVNLGGVDVSDNLTGLISIEAEESAARLATFTLRPAAGAVDVRDWIAAAVTIDYVPAGESGTRLFTGKVLEPVYDPETRLTVFQCSDDLQGLMEGKTEAQILALLAGGTYTGRYSEQVFGPRDDGWRQTEDILSTIPCGFDLLKDGTTTALTPWADTGLDAAFTAANARAVQVEIARLRDIVNSITVEADYRYSREHHREHQFNWAYDGLCDFIEFPYELPTRDMIRQASEGLQWLNKGGGICYGTLPPSGDYCNGLGLSVSDEAAATFVTSASWRGVRRWVQTIVEQYRVTVRESGSIADYGTLAGEDGAGLEVANDDASWNASLDPTDPDSPSGGALGGYSDTDCGSTLLTAGTCWEWTDKHTEADRTNLLNCLLQVADRKIRASHRANFVQWQSWVQPDIERTLRVSVDAGGVVAQGKVFQYRHDLDLGRGSALTSIKIAVSKCPAGGTEDTLTAPARPDTTTLYDDPAPSTDMTSYIGFQNGAAAYDEDWVGLTSNRATYLGATGDEDKIYPIRFKVDGPDIETEAVELMETEQAVTIDITIADETLTVTA